MSHTFNHLDQPIGQSLAEWTAPSPPPREPMEGRFCQLEPLDPNVHAQPLHAANVSDVEGRSWTYLPYGPFESVEVGHIHYSEHLKRSPVATEAMFLMMKRAFGLGYRRYEWKCDALNGPSRAAAQRLGFSVKPLCTKGVVVTPPGTRPLIRSGPYCTGRFLSGWTRATSTRMGSSGAD